MKAALNRLTVAAAGETEGHIAVNALTPQTANITPAVEAPRPVARSELFEPVETMAEAALALCIGDPSVLTGRIAYSLQLLLELDRPVYDLRGEHLVGAGSPPSSPPRYAFVSSSTRRTAGRTSSPHARSRRHES